MVINLNKRYLRTLFGHLVLSIFFCWYYANNAFLRPAVESGTEYFLALLIVVAVEINFWLLYPALQNNKHTFLYIMLSAMEIITLSVVE